MKTSLFLIDLFPALFRCKKARYFVLVASMFLGLGAAFSNGQTLNEGFASGIPAGWTIINNSNPVGPGAWSDGDTNQFTANSGTGNAFVGVGYNAGSGASTLSTWLLSPITMIKNGDVLSFYSRSKGSVYPDRMEVRLSLAGGSSDVGATESSVGDFTTVLLTINPDLTPTGYPSTWTHYTATITGVPTPTEGRFAFRYYVTNGGPSGSNSDYIGIDDVVFPYGPKLSVEQPAGTALSSSVFAWGENDSGQTSAPVAAQSGVTAIAAGYYHTVALKSDGSVIAWGDHYYGQTTVPATAESGVTAIAAGGYHTVALKNDGSVIAWGRNSFGQTTVPATAQSGVTAIAAGYFNTVALKSDGSVIAWGDDFYGQTTVPVAAQSGVTAISAGDSHTVALKSDGSVIAWGDDYYGQTTVPTAALSGVTAIAAGYHHTMALKNDGSVIAWGDNTVGQTNVPAAAQTGVTAIAAGDSHSVALKSDGSVIAWRDGQTTVPAAAQSGVTAIAAGGNHNVVLRGPSIDFGPQQVAGTAPLKTVSLKNSGTAALTISSASLTGYNASDFTLDTSGMSTSVAPGASTTVSVTFTPSAAGPRQTTLRIASNDSSQSTFEITLTGAGLSTNADLSNLALSTGSLTPAFASGTMAYSVAVPSGTSSITITPTKADANASIQVRVNGGSFASVNSGSASGALALLTGPNTVDVRVTAEDGSTVKTYTVLVSTLPSLGGSGMGSVPDGSGSDGSTPGSPLDITFAVSGRSGVVSNVVVDFTMNPAHTWMGDLVVTLIAPDGTEHRVFGGFGGGADLGGLFTFTDSASGLLSTTVAASTSAPLPGRYRTELNFAATSLAATFDGKSPNGAWKLRFQDFYAGDTGTVSAAHLYLDLRAAPPAVTTPTFANVTTSSATLGGTITSDGGATITERGIVLSPTLTNSDPLIDGTGVIKLTSTSTAEVFTLEASSLQASTGYTFKAYAINSAGTGYSAAGSLATLAALPKLSAEQPAGTALFSSVLAWGANDQGQATIPAAAQNEVITVAAGAYHTVALKTDRSVIAWGWNQHGQTTVPATAQRGVAAIAAGYSHTVALKTDGSVIAWGDNTSGQTTVPAAAQSGVTAIAAGNHTTFALKNDGSVIAWGDNTSGLTTVPAEAQSGVVAIAAGSAHALALRNDGSVIAWGWNLFGQTNVPEIALSGVTAIAGSNRASMALKNDGSVIAWGDSFYEEGEVLADAQTVVTAIAAGQHFMMALKSDGSVITWGHSSSVPAAAQSGVTAIAAGSDHAVALKAPAIAFAPQLVATTSSAKTITLKNSGTAPLTITSVTPAGGHASDFSVDTTGMATTIAPSGSTTFTVSFTPSSDSPRHTMLRVLSSDSLRSPFDISLTGTGTALPPTATTPTFTNVSTTSATLGGTITSDGGGMATERGIVLSPTTTNGDPLIGGTGVTKITISGNTGLFTLRAGALEPGTSYTFRAFATNSGGTGYSATASFTTQTDMPKLSIEQPAGTALSSTVLAWGRSTYGQTTVPASAQSEVTAIAAGSDHTVALKIDGSVIAWGDNTFGQINVPADAQTGVGAIAAGYYRTVALKNDGSVIAWGMNIGSVPAAAQSGVAAIAAGSRHTVALKTDGSVVAWGDNTSGQTTVPAAAQSGVIAIAAGWDHTVALRNDGSVIAWGSNSQNTVPAAAQSGVRAIAAGNFCTTALKTDGSVITWENYGNGQVTELAAAQSGVIAIATHSDRTVALKNDGSVLAWGGNYFGESTVPVTAQSGVTAIAAGGYHTVVLKGISIAFGSQGVAQAGSPKTFVLKNTGTAPLAISSVTLTGGHTSDFSVDTTGMATTIAAGGSTTFTVSFTPHAAGALHTTLRVLSNDASQSPYDIDLTGTGTAPPEVAVFNGASTDLANERTDNTGTFTFANTSVGSTSSAQTFTIKNTGTANLTGLAITKTGDFTITQPAATTLAPDATTTFTVTFAPTARGTRNGVISIASNDADENPFEINVSGAGLLLPAPVLSYFANGLSVFFNAHNEPLPGAPFPTSGGVVYARTDTNAAPLIGGSGVTNLETELVNTGFDGLSAEFTPGVSYTFRAYLSNADGVGYSSPETVTFAPEIAVFNGASTDAADERTDNTGTFTFGNTNVGSTSSAQTFTIKNVGNFALASLAVTKTGDFTVTQPFGSGVVPSLEGDAYTTFTVTFAPTAAGTRTGVISIASNDADENPFEINVSGTGVTPGPEIAVFTGGTHPANERTDNTGTFAFADNGVGVTSDAQAFVIMNTGSADLTGIAITKTGDFTITSPVITTLAPGAGISIFVRFVPTALGLRTGVISIASNDADENPFEINVSGTGVVAVPSLAELERASLDSTSASFQASITSDGGDSITERGVLLLPSTAAGPLVVGGDGVVKIISTDTSPTFTVAASELTPDTRYSAVAYAINSAGTGYSGSAGFYSPAPSLPVVTVELQTDGAGLPTGLLGTVVDSGGGVFTHPGTSRGFRHAKVDAHIDPRTLAGSGFGVSGVSITDAAAPFTRTLQALAPGSYVGAAYARNTRGFGYSELIYFTIGSVGELVVEENGKQVASAAQYGGNLTSQFQKPPVTLTDPVSLSSNAAVAARRTDGSFLVWGPYAPVAIPSTGSGLKSVAGSSGHILALGNDGVVTTAWLKSSVDPAASYVQVPADLGPVVAIATARQASFAVKANGTVVAWGDPVSNNDGTPDTVLQVPAGLSDVIHLHASSGSNRHALALKRNGTVVAWGANGAGQCNVPADLTDVIAIEAGWNLSLALRRDGTTVAWGSVSAPPSGLGPVKAIASFSYAPVYLLRDGTVVTTNSVATIPAGLTGVSGVTGDSALVTMLMGGLHFADQSTGTPSSARTLTLTNKGSAPLTFSSISVVGLAASDFAITTAPTTLAAGESATVNVTFQPTAEGERYAALRMVSNDPDNPTRDVVLTGTATVALNPEIAVFNGASTAAGDERTDNTGTQSFANTNVGSTSGAQTFTLKNTGTADLTGLAITQTGDFTITQPALTTLAPDATTTFTVSFVPTATGTRSGVISIASNDADENPFEINVSGTGSPAGFPKLSVEMPAGLELGGYMVGWGYESNGEASAADDLNGITQLVAGGYHTLALRDGKVLAWGQNTDFQCNVPAGLTDIVSIGASRYGSYAVRSNGSVVAWGDGNTPFLDWHELTNVKSVTGGISWYGNAVLFTDGTVQSWNLGEQPEGLDHVKAIAVGEYHILALKEDGHVVAWGNDYYGYGMLNVPEGLENVIAIAAGASHSVALKADGSVVVWGGGSYYGPVLTAIPEGATNITHISAMGYGVSAVRDDGSIFTWGPTYQSKLPPASVSGLTSLSSGYNHTVALVPGVSFGRAAVGGTAVSRTLTLRNTGTASFTQLSATVSGDESIILSEPPAVTLAPDGTTIVKVSFSPGAVGAHSAKLSIRSGDETLREIALDGLGVEQTSPPSSSDFTLTLAEDQKVPADAWSFSDSDDNRFTGVLITSLPDKGQLYVNNEPLLEAGYIVPVGNTFFYQPEQDESGIPYASFTFKVMDDGLEGSNIATEANTVTINVTPASEPPLGGDRHITVPGNGRHVFTPTDFAFSDPNDTPPNNFTGVRIMNMPESGHLMLNGQPLRPFILENIGAEDTGIADVSFVPQAGKVWKQCSPQASWDAIASSADGTKVIAIGRDGDTPSLYRSTDGGKTWSVIGDEGNWCYVASSADGLILYATTWNEGGNGMIYKSTNGGDTWTALTPTGGFSTIACSANGLVVYAGTYESGYDDIFGNYFESGQLHASTDGGATWSIIGDDSAKTVVACSADGSTVAVGSPFDVQVSHDFGATFPAVYEAYSHVQGLTCSSDGQKLAAAVRYEGVATSSDGGSHWSLNSDVSVSSYGVGLAASGDGGTLLLANRYSRLKVSYNQGASWVDGTRSSFPWLSAAISADGSRMLAGSEDSGNYGDVAVSEGSGYTELSNGHLIVSEAAVDELVYYPATRIFGFNEVSNEETTPDDGFLFRVMDDGSPSASVAESSSVMFIHFGPDLPEPTFTDLAATDITPTSATLRGTLVNEDDVAIAELGFNYQQTVEGYTYYYTIYSDSNQAGPFSASVPSVLTGVPVFCVAFAELSNGSTIYSEEFSFIPAESRPVAVGNLVFFDRNGNGRADAGEGVDGVTVTLYHADDEIEPSSAVRSTTTSGGGLWLMDNLSPGSYRLHIPSTMFVQGAPLYHMKSVAGEMDSGDDDLGEKGQDSGHLDDYGIVSRTFTLAAGLAPAGDNEQGINSLSDDAADHDVDLTRDFGFVDIINLPPTFTKWKQERQISGPGTGDHDDDGQDDLLEYALGDQSDPTHQFRLEDNRTTDETNVHLRRRRGGQADIIFAVQFCPDLTGAQGDWEPTVINPIITINADGTETLTYPNVTTDPALQGHQTGFTRLLIMLDANGDGNPEQITKSDILGWQHRPIAPGTQTYGLPFVRPAIVSAKVSSNTSNTLELPVSYDLGPKLVAGEHYYVEVLDGDEEGQRYEVIEPATTANIITLDLANTLSTQSYLSTTLVGDTIAIRPHWRVKDLFPPAEHTAGTGALNADQIHLWSASEAKFLPLFLGRHPTLGGIWTLVGHSGSQNDRIIAPADGLFVKPRQNVITAADGQVRTWKFACPLQAGNNLIGNPYPIAQSFAQRGMSITNGFTAAASASAADRVNAWSGDGGGSGTPGYVPHMLAPNNTWARPGELPSVNRTNDPVFTVGTAAFIHSISGHPHWIIPAAVAP